MAHVVTLELYLLGTVEPAPLPMVKARVHSTHGQLRSTVLMSVIPQSGWDLRFPIGAQDGVGGGQFTVSVGQVTYEPKTGRFFVDCEDFNDDTEIGKDVPFAFYHKVSPHITEAGQLIWEQCPSGTSCGSPDCTALYEFTAAVRLLEAAGFSFVT